MGKPECQAGQTKPNRMEIIFKFPAESTQDEVIRKEVKSIMTSALKEQLHRPS